MVGGYFQKCNGQNYYFLGSYTATFGVAVQAAAISRYWPFGLPRCLSSSRKNGECGRKSLISIGVFLDPRYLFWYPISTWVCFEKGEETEVK